MNSRKKVSIIGAGLVGGACTQRIAEKGYADVVLLDVSEGLAQGKALDIMQSAPLLNFDSRVIGTTSFQETANSDIGIIASGIGKKAPGGDRDKLLLANRDIVADVTRNVVKYSPNCIIIVVSNPVDAMTYLVAKVSQLPRNRVLGLSGVLDSARFASFIAAELGVSVANVSACVLGQHGYQMVIIPRLTTVNGVPITELLPRETIDKLAEHAVQAGGEIIQLFKESFGASSAPSAAITEMVDVIIRDRKKVLTCAAYLQGEYGIKDAVTGVPVKLGMSGIEQVIELELTSEEKAALIKAAGVVRELAKTMKLS